MKVVLAIIFWTLAALQGAVLLLMLFFGLAAGPRMAENGDVWTPLFWNVLLPLLALAGAIFLFVRIRSPLARAVALLVVLAPLYWMFSWTEGETIYTTFENGKPTVVRR